MPLVQQRGQLRPRKPSKAACKKTLASQQCRPLTINRAVGQVDAHDVWVSGQVHVNQGNQGR